MTYPQMDDRNADDSKSWLLAAAFVALLMTGLALWAYTSGDLQRSATLTEPDLTTGQSIRPPLH